MVLILLVSFIGTGCGPSKEEIMAREQAEAQARAADEARQKEQEAKLARIRAMEVRGDDEARQGELGKALINYREVLKNVQRYSDQDQRVRQAVIKVVRSMPAPPPLPENVVRNMARGEAKLKMGGAGSYEAAAKEMEQAVLEAPWLTDGYYNLGIVQEKAEMFGRAIQNLKLYLLAFPQSSNANAIQAKIYGLEVMQEEQQKTQSLAGIWLSKNSGRTYKVTIEGKKIHIELQTSEQVRRSYDLEKKGDAIEGFVQLSSMETFHGCYTPSETVPASGFIREDGNYLKVISKETYYQYSWQDNVCTSVSSMGKQETVLEIFKQTGN